MSHSEKSALKGLAGEGAVIEVAKYTASVIKLIQSSAPSEIGIAIAAATGRRMIEVIDIGQFTAEKGSSDAYLESVDPAFVFRFRNPAKKRNYAVPDDEKPEFSTTSLVQVDDLLNAWKTLKATADVKAYLKEADKLQRATAKAAGAEAGDVERRAFFNRQWKDRFSKVVADYFSFLPGKLTDEGDRKSPTPKDLRPAFAQLSYVRDVEKDGQGQPLKGSEILFKGQILGHYIESSEADKSLKRLSSTLSYYGYRADSMPTYPDKISEKEVRMRLFEGDREWLNSLIADKTQAETFRYLKTKHEALEAENLKLRQELREAEAAKLAAEAQPAAAPPNAIEKQLAALTKQVAALAGNQPQRELQGQPKAVAVPTALTARLDTPPQLSDRQMKAYQWLDIVVGTVKDHNQQANGDVWQMWALSPRMLKDVSGVNQKLVKEFWLSDEKEFNALNEHWGLDDQHNRRRGMKKHKVTDDLNLERSLELL